MSWLQSPWSGHLFVSAPAGSKMVQHPCIDWSSPGRCIHAEKKSQSPLTSEIKVGVSAEFVVLLDTTPISPSKEADRDRRLLVFLGFFTTAAGAST